MASIILKIISLTVGFICGWTLWTILAGRTPGGMGGNGKKEECR